VNRKGSCGLAVLLGRRAEIKRSLVRKGNPEKVASLRD
jgi:hypothetical protein